MKYFLHISHNIKKTIKMSATDFDLDFATMKVNKFKNIQKIVYKKIDNFYNANGGFMKYNCKEYFKNQITEYIEIIYDKNDITKNIKLEKMKTYLEIYIAFRESSETFGVIIFELMRYLYNIEQTYDNPHKIDRRNQPSNILIYNVEFCHPIRFYNSFLQLIPIINAKKMLNIEIYKRIHKKKQQPMHNEFFEFILHPDNMEWMIEHELIENNLTNTK